MTQQIPESTIEPGAILRHNPDVNTRLYARVHTGDMYVVSVGYDQHREPTACVWDTNVKRFRQQRLALVKHVDDLDELPSLLQEMLRRWASGVGRRVKFEAEYWGAVRKVRSANDWWLTERWQQPR